MFVLPFFALVGGLGYARAQSIDLNAEYPDPAFSTIGSSVTLLAPGGSFNLARFYGAIVVGSVCERLPLYLLYMVLKGGPNCVKADETTTYHLVPTILIRDTPVFDPLVSTMIVAPKTVIQSYSVQDMSM